MSLDTKHIKSFVENKLERIRNFLFSKEFREFLILLFFVFVSFLFWLLDTLKNDFERTFNIPVKIVNVPEDYVITSEQQKTVKVTVKAKGTDLFNHMFTDNLKPVDIDFSTCSKNTESEMRLSSADCIKKMFPATARIISVVPDSVSFIYSNNRYVKYPVVFNGTVKTDRMHIVADTIISPDSVKVYFPASINGADITAETEDTMLKDLSDTTTVNLKLKRIEGVKFVPDKVKVTFPVEIFSEQALYVPVKGINFPEGKNLRTFPAKIKVTFQTRISKLRDIKPKDIVVGIDYKDIAADGNSTSARLKVVSYPSDVKNIRLSSEFVDFLIEDKLF